MSRTKWKSVDRYTIEMVGNIPGSPFTGPRVYITHPNKPDWWKYSQCWTAETPEAVAIANEMMAGTCPPGVFADYIEEHPALCCDGLAFAVELLRAIPNAAPDVVCRCHEPKQFCPAHGVRSRN